jgi:hypothetical protein
MIVNHDTDVIKIADFKRQFHGERTYLVGKKNWKIEFDCSYNICVTRYKRKNFIAEISRTVFRK